MKSVLMWQRIRTCRSHSLRPLKLIKLEIKAK